MAKTYNRMNIDIDSNVLSAVTGVQLDSQSRFLDVSLYANSAAIDLTGHTVRLLVRKADGTVSYVQGEVKEPVNGRCQFELTNQMLAKVGWLELQIELWQGTSVLSTKPFELYVVETLRNEEEVESSNEYGALVVLFQEIQDSLDLMRKMTDSFGLPGQKAAQFGVDSFWGMMEILAERADTKDLLKRYINGTIDTTGFQSLDTLIKTVGDLVQQHGVRQFTANGTFTVPKGVSKIWVTAFGGGGGGDANGTGGQGGDYVIRRPFQVTQNSNIAITIGAGGQGYTGSTTPPTPATAGGYTRVGSLITVDGGQAGTARTHKGAMGSPSGGNGKDTAFAIGGNAGSSSGTSSTPYPGGGGGGAGFGNGGNGGNGASSNPRSGTNGGIGAGGGGGGAGYSRYGNGGNGGDGIVIIEW